MKKVFYILTIAALTGLAVSCGSSEPAGDHACCQTEKKCAATDSCKKACEAKGKECKKDSTCAAKCEAKKDSSAAE